MLQLTSLLFLIPAFEAYHTGLLLPSAVYTTNAVVSFAVHRPGRLPNFDWIDVIDHLCIGLWVAVNLSMVRLTPPFIPAILCAILVAAFRWWTKQLEWRSGGRKIVHAFMHTFGAVGSLFLLDAVKRS